MKSNTTVSFQELKRWKIREKLFVNIDVKSLAIETSSAVKKVVSFPDLTVQSSPLVSSEEDCENVNVVQSTFRKPRKSMSKTMGRIISNMGGILCFSQKFF
jgi:hypothetical protein